MRLKTFLPFLIIWTVILAIPACKKDKYEPQPMPLVSKIPEIELISVAPQNVIQFQDSIIFSIFFIDGDGDIGEENSDSTTLFITDNRFPLTHTFHVPPVSPHDINHIVQGPIKVTLRNLILKNQGNTEETATFDIQIKDRAGNQSNKITTGNITIKK